MNDTYLYPSSKLADARHCLMLPHVHGETKSIAEAFQECRIGLDRLSDDDLQDDAQTWAETISQLMAKAETDVSSAAALTDDEKVDLRYAVDELASWLARRSWEETHLV